MTMTRLLQVVVAFLAVVLSTAAVQAQTAPPKIITQQGRLVDTNGDPVTGDLNFVFNIYDVATAGTPLYTEVQTITLDNGYFSTRVGETTVIPDALFSGAALWIGITVGTDSEMAPRQPIASVPYAFLAREAINAVGAITPTSVTVNGTTVIDATGAWTGAIPDRPFSGLISAIQGTASAPSTGGPAGRANISVACANGSVATGGGCNTTTGTGSGSTDVYLKASYPTITNGKATGWNCSCSAATDTGVCAVTPYVICATN